MSIVESVSEGQRVPARAMTDRRIDLRLLAAVAVLGAVIRFASIGQQSFWYDEAFTHNIVSGSLGHVFSGVSATESTPPLYYVLAWGWTQIFGTGEVGLRSLSALCGTLTIPVMWALGRRVADERVAFAAALLTAVSPILFWYSQEARAYALFVLVSALSLLAMLRALERPTPGRLAQWSLAGAAALCTHYFSAFVLIPEAAWLAATLVHRRRLTLPNFAAGTVPVVVMGAALIPLLAHQNDGRASSLAGGGGSVPYRIAQLVRQDLVGFGQPAKAAMTGLAGLALLAAIGLLALRSSSQEKRRSLLPVAIGAGGALIALIVSLGTTDYFESRNLLGTWPALALVVAIGVSVLASPRLGAAALALLSVVSLICIIGVIGDSALQRPDWRDAAHALGPASGPRAIVGDRLSPLSLTPYLQRLVAYPAAGAPVSEIGVIETTASQADSGFERMPPPNPPSGFTAQRRLAGDGWVVEVYRASTPVRVSAATLAALGPVNGEDKVMLQR